MNNPVEARNLPCNARKLNSVSSSTYGVTNELGGKALRFAL